MTFPSEPPMDTPDRMEAIEKETQVLHGKHCLSHDGGRCDCREALVAKPTEQLLWEYREALGVLIASEIGDALSAEAAGEHQTADRIGQRVKNVVMYDPPALLALLSLVREAVQDSDAMLRRVANAVYDACEREEGFDEGASDWSVDIQGAIDAARSSVTPTTEPEK